MPQTRATVPAKAKTRPVVVPLFGTYLQQLRKRLRGTLSTAAICRLMAERHGLGLDRSTLFQYEKGTVEAPDPALLYGLADIYAVSLDDLIGRLARERGLKLLPTLLPPPLPLDPDQRHFVELVSRMDDEARAALRFIADRLAPRRVELREPDRRHSASDRTPRARR